jgi:hypothetical protein
VKGSYECSDEVSLFMLKRKILEFLDQLTDYQCLNETVCSVVLVSHGYTVFWYRIDTLNDVKPVKQFLALRCI